MSDTISWPLFDRIIELSKSNQWHTSPWWQTEHGLKYVIDETTLVRLLGVPTMLGAQSQSGLLAKPLDVWAAHELRRAGFDPDFIWPRDSPPRLLPAPVSKFIEGLPASLRDPLRARVYKDVAIKDVSATNANILGKLYEKQVDAGMARWQTGAEVLISGKRMDSSFGNNTKNRAEESYGDAKNLRLRYPLAALGFIFAV